MGINDWGDYLNREEIDELRPWLEKWHNHREPINRLGWDTYFLKIAQTISERSVDANSRFGCVLVSKTREIISTGYNSFPKNIDDSLLPNSRGNDNSPCKLPFMCHAEANAVIFAPKIQPQDEVTAYVTGVPCTTCLRLMMQANIHNIVCLTKQANMISGDEEEQIVFRVLVKLGNINIKYMEL